MKPTVYIETTVVSYLTAWPSRDIVRAGQQRSTRDWWDKHSAKFDLVTSELSIVEASAGDPTAAAERIKVLALLPVLPLTTDIRKIADQLLVDGAFPDTAKSDAVHIAIAASNAVTYLLTWNFRHLANATLRGRIQRSCERAGFPCPTICTPDELL